MGRTMGRTMGRRPRRPRPGALAGALLVGVAALTLAASSGAGRRFAPPRRTAIGALPQAVVVDARTRRAFVAHQDGTIDVLDATTGALVRAVRVGRFGYGQDDIAIAGRAGHVFVASAGTTRRGTTVSVLDARSGDIIRTVAVGENPHCVVVDERRGRVFVATARGVSALDAHTAAVVRTIDVGALVNLLALDTRTGRLFVATEGTDRQGLVPIAGGAGAIRAIDARAGAVIHTVAVGREPSSMALDARTGRLFVVSTIDAMVDVLDTGTGRVVRRVAIAGQPRTVAIDGRNGHALVGATGFMDKWGRFTSPSKLIMLDARRGTVARVVTLGRSPLWQVAVDERRDRAYVVGDATTVVDTRRGGVLARLMGPDGVGGGMVAVDGA